MSIEQLRWKKYPVLNDGHICLVDVMGDDAAIVQAARISYGNDSNGPISEGTKSDWHSTCLTCGKATSWTMETEPSEDQKCKCRYVSQEERNKDRNLIRYLLSHGHTTPFEMVEFKFRIRVPMDCWRQWIRHRTANVNEYSTRYTEAIDSFQTTEPTEWRLQASNNKQGSEGFLEEWPEGRLASMEHKDGTSTTFDFTEQHQTTPGQYLSDEEEDLHYKSSRLYQKRIALGIAKEQARKDLPLSTYTEAYWKCDLHNIFNFLRLRMDSHAQYEIRMYANAMAEIVKQVVPIAWEAFEDYVLYAKKFSRMEMEILKGLYYHSSDGIADLHGIPVDKPDSMTQREWREFLEKLA